MKNDRDICKLAVSINGLALFFASQNIALDREIVIIAV